jgi:hypothetical protein
MKIVDGDEMVQPALSSSPEDPDRPAKRLTPDEPIWEPPRAPAPPRGPAPRDPARRPLWRRALRVNLLLAGAVVVLLLAGFGVGSALRGPDAAAPSLPPSATTPAAATVTSIVVQPGPPTRACATAVEWADKAIAYLVANVRDERLTQAIQRFAQAKQACQQAQGG